MKVVKPQPREALLTALVALEDALLVHASVHGVSDDVERKFERYQKIKALALGSALSVEAQNEAQTALRTAIIELVKLVV